MKLAVLFTLVLLTTSLTLTEEDKVLANSGVSLVELLERVKEISSQLAQESLLELSTSYLHEFPAESPNEDSTPSP